MAEDPHLRVLIADEDQRRVAEIANVISGLGHSVVAQLLDVSEIADATGHEHPDVAIVGVDGEQSHALELISAIVKQATCPVIADIESDDDSFLKNAARRGIFAYVSCETPRVIPSRARRLLTALAPSIRGRSLIKLGLLLGLFTDWRGESLPRRS